MRRSVWWFSLSLIAAVGCGGGSGGGGETDLPLATASASNNATNFGHFVGEATSGNEALLVEALVTVDGAARMHVSSFWWDRGSLQGGGGPAIASTDLEQSMQFVGEVVFEDGPVHGSGVIIGQTCHKDGRGRFCDAPAEATLSYVANEDGTLEGELRVATPTGPEIWSLDLQPWSVYYESGALAETASYKEELAPFAFADDVLIDIANERMTFQSAASGCTGEGSIRPRGDGAFDEYDVVLLIGNCKPPYAHLNGELQGLATHTQSGAWDYDNWLVMFLAAPNGPPPRSAVSLRAHQQ